MRICLALGIGAMIGAISGATIYFSPQEPYKFQTVLAETLRNSLVAILIILSLRPGSSYWLAAGLGILYGLWTGALAALAHGASAAKHAAIIMPFAALVSAITGMVLVRFA